MGRKPREEGSEPAPAVKVREIALVGLVGAEGERAKGLEPWTLKGKFRPDDDLRRIILETAEGELPPLTEEERWEFSSHVLGGVFQRLLHDRIAVRTAFISERLEEASRAHPLSRADRVHLERYLLQLIEGAGLGGLVELLAHRGNIPIFQAAVSRELGLPLGRVKALKDEGEWAVTLRPEAVKALIDAPREEKNAGAFHHRIELALLWPEALHGWRSDNAAELGARLALAAIDDPDAESPAAFDRLQGETKRALDRAQGAIGKDRVGPLVAHDLTDEERDGMLAIDAAAADWLAELDAPSAEGFRTLRRQAFADWRNDPARADPELDLGGPARPRSPAEFWLDWVGFARALAVALWAKEIKPRLERERVKPAALVRAVHIPVMGAFSPMARAEETNGQRVLIFEGQNVLMANPQALADASVAQALAAEKGLALLRSIAAHRLLRWLVFGGHRQAIEGAADPRLIRIEGGQRELARLLGMKSNAAAKELGDVIEALHLYDLPIPFTTGGRGRFLSREIIPHAPRQRAVLNLILGTALLPDYVEELRAGRGIEARLARRLIPMVDLPPMKGLARDRDHGALASLSMGVVLHLRDHARELVTRGGAPIDPATWVRLGQGAGVPTATIARLREGWTRDGEDAPAFLKLVERDRYTLSDNHAAARAFIEEGGKKEIDGRRGGEEGKRAKTAKLERIARGRGGRRGQ